MTNGITGEPYQIDAPLRVELLNWGRRALTGWVDSPKIPDPVWNLTWYMLICGGTNCYCHLLSISPLECLVRGSQQQNWYIRCRPCRAIHNLHIAHKNGHFNSMDLFSFFMPDLHNICVNEKPATEGCCFFCDMTVDINSFISCRDSIKEYYPVIGYNGISSANTPNKQRLKKLKIFSNVITNLRAPTANFWDPGLEL